MDRDAHNRTTRFRFALAAATVPALILVAAMLISPRIHYHYWDNFEYFTPYVMEAHGRLLQGDFPHWNQYQHMGEPTHAQSQVGILYPLYTLCVAVVHATRIPASAFMSLCAVLHTGLAALGLYLLLMNCKVRPSLALAGALSGVMSGHMLYLASAWGFILPVFTWFIWALWGLKKVVEGHSPRSAGLISILSLLLLYNIGYPQSAFYGWIGGALFAAGYAAMIRAPWRVWLRLAAIGVITILLTMPCLLPTWTLRALTQRAGRMPYDMFVSRGINFRALSGLLLPVYRGSDGFIEFARICTTYMGAWLLPALLAVAALVAAGRKRSSKALQTESLRLMLLASAIGTLFLWLSLGETGGLFPLTHAIPLWSSFRWPFKLFLYAIPLFMLAGSLALQSLSQNPPTRSTTVVVAACIAVAGALWVMRACDLNAANWLAGLAGLAVMGSLLALHKPWGRLCFLIFLILSICGLLPIVHHPGRIRAYTHEDMYSFGADALGISTEYRILPLSGPWSDDGIMQELGLFQSATMNRYYSLTGCTAGLVPSSFTHLVPSATQGTLPGDTARTLAKSRLIRTFNVKYLIASKRDAEAMQTATSSPGYHLLRETPNAMVFENSDALQRAFFAEELIPYREDMLRDGLLENKKPLKTAYVAGLERPETPASGNVRSIAWNHNRLEFEVEAPEGGFVVVSMNYYPEWKAYADGHAAALKKVNGTICGVRVPAGCRTLSLQYDARSFRLGLRYAVLGLALLSVFLATNGRPGDQRRRSAT